MKTDATEEFYSWGERKLGPLGQKIRDRLDDDYQNNACSVTGDYFGPNDQCIEDIIQIVLEHAKQQQKEKQNVHV